MTQPPPTRQVFISHSATDRVAAEVIRVALEAAGVSCWIAPRDIPPGAEWADAIMAGIAEARLVLLIHSASSAASQMVRREVNVAVDGRTPVIPVRIDSALPQEGMQFYLGSTHWLDAAAGELAGHLGKIVAAVVEQLRPAGAQVLPAPTRTPPTLALPDNPSIAVLPFTNIGGDPEQEYFADGMTEEIITALSRVRSFFVIARNSSFTYKGRPVDAKQVGRELGVRYVVEGSVRRGGNRVRITAQLADALAGTQIWADRFDGAIEDVFELQDRVAASIIGAIEPRIVGAEIERANRKPPGDLRAYDLMLQALPGLETADRVQLAASEALLRRAIALAPDYAPALARLSNCIWRNIVQGWVPDTALARAEIGALVRHAVVTGRSDPEVLARAGNALGICHDQDAGIGLIEQALALHPNSSVGLTMGALLHAYTGQLAKVMDYIERAARLNPFEGVSERNHAAAIAHFANGQHERVLDFAALALRARPGYVPALRYRTASLGLLGRIDEAQQSAQELRAAQPALTVASARRHLEVDLNNAHKVPGAVDALCEGLRVAGIPEA